MKRMMRIAATLTALASGAAGAQFAPGVFDNARLVGVWSWTRPVDKCTDTYEFRADGTLSLTSGAERTENTYRLQAKPYPGTARYMLVINTLRDNGGADCLGAAVDDSGQSTTVYIQFDTSGTAGFIVCKDPLSAACVGPMQRK